VPAPPELFDVAVSGGALRVARWPGAGAGGARRTRDHRLARVLGAAAMSVWPARRRTLITWLRSFGGRPPVRPAARAVASPVMVRSRIRSRSKWERTQHVEQQLAARSRGIEPLGQRTEADAPVSQGRLSRSSFYTTTVSPVRA
jgi:hypothetical protein